jgi:hypothetical protein
MDMKGFTQEAAQAENERRMKQEAGLKLCQVCGNWDILPAADGEGGIGEWCPHCNEIRWTQTSTEEIIDLQELISVEEITEYTVAKLETHLKKCPVCGKWDVYTVPSGRESTCEGFPHCKKCVEISLIQRSTEEIIDLLEEVKPPFQIAEDGCCPVCPQCGYERQPKDEDFVLRRYCPKCGVLYAEFLDFFGQEPNKLLQTNDLELKWQLEKQCQSTGEHIIAGHSTLSLVIISTCLIVMLGYIISSSVAHHNLKQNGFATAGITQNISSDSYQKASVLHAVGQYDDELSFAKAASGGAERKAEADSIELSNSQPLLAKTQKDPKNYEEAVQHMEGLRSIKEVGLGKRDPKVADTTSDLISEYETQGDTYTAERLNNLADSRLGEKARSVRSLRNSVHQNHHIEYIDIDSSAKMLDLTE